MLRLSHQQVRAFEDQQAYRFAKRVAQEIPGYRGPLVANRDESTLYSAAIASIDRGRLFGLTSERALFQYANLCVTLGIAFDSDPALPWAKQILDDDSYLGNEKMDDLWNCYVDFCGRVMEGGEDAYFPRQALRHLRAAPPTPVGDGTLAPLLADLEALWPEKARDIGPAALKQHVMAALERAADLGLRSGKAQAKFCRIAFVLGYAFDSDPLHDWVWGALSQKDEGDIMAQLEESFATMVLDPCLAWQEGGDAPGNDEDD